MGAGLELFGKRRDGTEFPVEVSLTSIQTPAGTVAAAFVGDVTTPQPPAALSVQPLVMAVTTSTEVPTISASPPGAICR